MKELTLKITDRALQKLKEASNECEVYLGQIGGG